jgi:hypothetical protein
MDTIASLLTDAIVDSLISKYAKFHKGETVHCKANQREVVIVIMLVMRYIMTFDAVIPSIMRFLNTY